MQKRQCVKGKKVVSGVLREVKHGKGRESVPGEQARKVGRGQIIKDLVWQCQAVVSKWGLYLLSNLIKRT